MCMCKPIIKYLYILVTNALPKFYTVSKLTESNFVNLKLYRFYCNFINYFLI